jgi:hypothetical protein
MLVAEEGLGDAGADGCPSTNGSIADVGHKLQAALKVVRGEGSRSGAVIFIAVCFPL